MQNIIPSQKQHDCKQKEEESTDDFIHRVLEVVTSHGGYQRPERLNTAETGPWESVACNAIIKGLLPGVAHELKNIYVGWAEQLKLDDVRRYARHSQNQINARNKKEVKAEKELHLAAVSMHNPS